MSSRPLRSARRVAIGAGVAAAVVMLQPVRAVAATTTVTVTRGQDLWRIATTHGSTVAAVAAANHLRAPYIIRPGERLVIPAFGVHSVSDANHVEATHPAIDEAIDNATSHTGVADGLLDGVAWEESGWQQNVVSSTGAIGVAQVEPYTARFINQHLGTGNLNPAKLTENTQLAATYLAWLLAQAHDNERLAVAGYYQGIASVRAHGIYPSTARYVDNVMALTRDFSG